MTTHTTKKYTDQEFNPENALKGRMAETFVEELLKKSKNTVYRFGYEAIIQNLSQNNNRFDRHSDTGERIQTIPDFIVIDISGEPVFVEVKFRWDGKLFKDEKTHKDDKLKFEKIRTYWNAKIILVNSTERPYFRVLRAPYFDNDGKLISHPLSEEKGWKIDLAVYKKFEGLVERYLALPNKSQKEVASVAV